MAVFIHQKQVIVAVVLSRRRSARFLIHNVGGAFYTV